MKDRFTLIFAITCSTLLMTACKKKDDNSLTTLVTVPSGPPSFKANVTGTDITFTTFSYSIDTARLDINAKSDNYESLNFFLKPPRTKGSYQIDNYLNRAWFNMA